MYIRFCYSMFLMLLFLSFLFAGSCSCWYSWVCAVQFIIFRTKGRFIFLFSVGCFGVRLSFLYVSSGCFAPACYNILHLHSQKMTSKVVCSKDHTILFHFDAFIPQKCSLHIVALILNSHHSDLAPEERKGHALDPHSNARDIIMRT